MTDIGQRIKHLRQARGLTLAELAEASGISKSYVWEIEDDRKDTAVSISVLMRIAKSLKISISFLVGEAPITTAEDRAFCLAYGRLTTEQKRQMRSILQILEEGKNK